MHLELLDDLEHKELPVNDHKMSLLQVAPDHLLYLATSFAWFLKSTRNSGMYEIQTIHNKMMLYLRE